MAEQEKASAASLEDLLARCALRDRKAFAALYAATSANLFGIALRILKTRPWAEEVLQESFVKVWQHAGRYDAAMRRTASRALRASARKRRPG